MSLYLESFPTNWAGIGFIAQWVLSHVEPILSTHSLQNLVQNAQAKSLSSRVYFWVIFHCGFRVNYGPQNRAGKCPVHFLILRGSNMTHE